MSTEDKSVDVSLVNGPVNYEEPPFYRQGGGENAFLGRTRHEESASHGILKLLRYEAKESMATKVLLELQSNIMRFDLASRCFSRLLKKPWIAISYSSSEFATQLERFRWAMLQCSCR
mmetsp:Transcript_28692/g.92566  ORF Transcript_28692/g.92566 Transcript_28692/m.92566 type:complete len:118 (-) Transcript_28692:491-844(-)